MLTLILSAIQDNRFGEILGYILSALEVAIVILTLLSFFVDPKSKFGKFLSKFLKGLYKAKKYVEDEETKSKEEKKDETRSE